MNYLDLLGPKFVFFTLGLFAVACAAGDPVDSPHRNGTGSSGSTGLTSDRDPQRDRDRAGSSNDSTGTSTSSTGTGNTTTGSGAGGSAQSTGTAGDQWICRQHRSRWQLGRSDAGRSRQHDRHERLRQERHVERLRLHLDLPCYGQHRDDHPPTCPTPCFATAMKQLCVSGNVKGDKALASGASLGWNINQAEMLPNPVTTLATTGSGITVNVPGATATMRVQISAGSAEATQWCAPMPAGGMGTIKWGDFKNKCWTGGGAVYTVGTPIDAIQIVVPSATADTPFSFCLVSASIAP